MKKNGNKEQIKVTIDPDSGFCFGVVRAIKAVDNELNATKQLFCLGDIVHNGEEVARLQHRGLNIIDHNDLENLKDQKVIIRAHGEPRSTYEIAEKNNIQLIDATCPIVLRLQALIRKQYEEIKEHHGQIVIYGKPKHPEVIGLNGQTNNSGKIVENKNDLDKIDYNKPIRLFSQTTGNIEGFDSIIKEIKKRKEKSSNTSEFELEIFDTICRKVANRANQIREFAKKKDLVIFVSDKKSSNGKYLFGICKSVNKNSYYISDKSEIKKEWFRDVLNVGISGATSTPGWLMEEVSNKIKEIIN